ncbi:hypothetical protein NDU88_010289 [Pleurodeles waltl]|uniref:Uncharacterized protein n=1 Tax=Pleurodeles waltl TaxID=8319 RepID=A0AAV7S0A8_PLEWA|nr:hypothetical protein NDU88_010289 [Pleurodeles waltl]
MYPKRYRVLSSSPRLNLHKISQAVRKSQATARDTYLADPGGGCNNLPLVALPKIALTPDFRAACLPVGSLAASSEARSARTRAVTPAAPLSGDNAPAAHDRWEPRTTDFQTRREPGVAGQEEPPLD